MNRKLHYLILLADLFWIATCLWAVELLQANSLGHQQTFWLLLRNPAFFIAAIVWIALYVTKNLDGFRNGWYAPTIIAQTFVGVFYLVTSLCALAFFLRLHYSRESLLFLTLLLAGGFLAIRYTVHWMVDSRLDRRSARRVIIMGTGRMVRELIKKIARHPELCMEVVGVLFPSDADRGEDHGVLRSDTAALRTLNVLDRLQADDVHELILVEPIPSGSETEQLLASCRQAGLKVHLVPQQYELYLSKARLTEIEDVPLLSLQEHTLPTLIIHVKTLLDFLGAVLLVVLASPLLLFSTMFLCWRRGKALRSELRCGRDGKAFRMYRLNIERESEHLVSFERFLVQFSFTELPQLINVLRGEMSLVGPRPESPERVRHYSMWQRQRLTVKPGLTGLAQVHGFREQHSSEEKANFDLQYIFHWSLFLDLCLMIQTGWTLFERIVQEHRLVIPSLLKPLPAVNLELGSICDADSAQSGTD